MRAYYLYQGVQYSETPLLAGLSTLRDKFPDVYIASSYSVSDPTDIVSSRDFLPGVANCGRTFPDGKDTGVPYLLPFGKPKEWASIPRSSENEVSDRLLQSAVELFSSIESSSGRPVLLGDLKRGILNTRTGESSHDEPKKRVVDYLKKSMRR